MRTVPTILSEAVNPIELAAEMVALTGDYRSLMEVLSSDDWQEVLLLTGVAGNA